MSTSEFAACLEAAGVELDFRRMQLPANLEAHFGRLLDGAVKQMEEIERGDVVNTDEGWQVGHYWLRNPLLAPAEHREPINAALRSIEDFRQTQFSRFRAILWIGIGGSGLAPQLLYDALRKPGATPPMFFFDNTDPYGFQRTLREIELAGGFAQTLTVVVSKSGGTKETHIGMEVARHAYERAGLKFEEHAVAVTRPGSGLDQRAAGWLERFPIWDFVGGRTSLFSAVGMLPAHLCDLSADALCQGAKNMDDATRGRSLHENPALLLAASWYHAVEVLALRNMVVLPYADRLVMLPRYLQQLVMESLGKDGKGITVLGNKGSTDQHSYVQQLRDGYRDFFVVFLRTLIPATDWEVAAEKQLGIPKDVTAFDYLAAFQEGTAQALSDAGRLSLRITIDRVNEHSLGALVALFERAVGYYGAMLGINTYHQPGVEAGKKAADTILELQSKLTDILTSNRGKRYTVADLAKATKSDPVRIYDILRRLTRAARFGISNAPASDGGISGASYWV